MAVKLIKDPVAKGELASNLVTKEIGILRRLHHPNVVQLLDARQHGGQIYIVMEYCPGGDLRDLLAQAAGTK